jgi:hypothetical protein
MKQYNRRPVASTPNAQARSRPAIDPLEGEPIEEAQPTRSAPAASSSIAITLGWASVPE